LKTERQRDIIDIDDRPKCADEQKDGGLWGATPGCDGRVVGALGGGVKCTKCRGWFCY
jgi:hypothetical protein